MTTGERVELRVLGPIEVHHGHQLAVGGSRQRRIIAALAMHAGEVVSVDRLADIARARGEPPDHGARNVRKFFSAGTCVDADEIIYTWTGEPTPSPQHDAHMSPRPMSVTDR